MIELLTTEIIFGGALISTSALALVGSLVMMGPPKGHQPGIDIDALVRDAPYHRLCGAGIVVREPAQKS